MFIEYGLLKDPFARAKLRQFRSRETNERQSNSINIAHLRRAECGKAASCKLQSDEAR
ncbi:MAG: hypothetical protein QOF62_1563 [Pyrinomonadaceae bacterium]|jgi:hypothetical protein|nr:hypothetical protein [Pyrinomonadaceae bacterium]